MKNAFGLFVCTVAVGALADQQIPTGVTAVSSNTFLGSLGVIHIWTKGIIRAPMFYPCGAGNGDEGSERAGPQPGDRQNSLTARACMAGTFVASAHPARLLEHRIPRYISNAIRRWQTSALVRITDSSRASREARKVQFRTHAPQRRKFTCYTNIVLVSLTVSIRFLF
jgi:hypothetical protein